MTSSVWLFDDETLADVVNRRVAEAEAAKGEGADALIARLSLDVPVATGTREVSRWITESFIDRFDDEIPGGNLGIRMAYLFTGDATLLSVKPYTVDLASKFMGTVVGQSVEMGHMRGDNNEARLIEDIAATATRFAEILRHLRADALPHNAELARRIRELCG